MSTRVIRIGSGTAMDLEEIVLRIEEDFGIDLHDEELASIRTVGELYGLILRKLETRPSTLPAPAFYQLRRAMMRCLDLPRKSIRPSTKLSALLPGSTRIAAWKSISEVSDLTFPRLRHPRWARDTIRCLTALAAIAFVVAMVMWTNPGGVLWIPVFLGSALAALFSMKILYAATAFLAREFPTRTAGELSQQLVALNVTKCTQDSGGRRQLNKQDVWRQLVYIFSDQMQLDPSEIVPEAHIAEDLGIG